MRELSIHRSCFNRIDKSVETFLLRQSIARAADAGTPGPGTYLTPTESINLLSPRHPYRPSMMPEGKSVSRPVVNQGYRFGRETRAVVSSPSRSQSKSSVTTDPRLSVRDSRWQHSHHTQSPKDKHSSLRNETLRRPGVLPASSYHAERINYSSSTRAGK